MHSYLSTPIPNHPLSLDLSTDPALKEEDGCFILYSSLIQQWRGWPVVVVTELPYHFFLSVIGTPFIGNYCKWNQES